MLSEGFSFPIIWGIDHGKYILICTIHHIYALNYRLEGISTIPDCSLTFPVNHNLIVEQCDGDDERISWSNFIIHPNYIYNMCSGGTYCLGDRTSNETSFTTIYHGEYVNITYHILSGTCDISLYKDGCIIVHETTKI